ncbi:MAG: hypothetical protein LBO82_04185 [Synergistaceae bacterium]|jgi:predicted HAD superfamily Cof-like phosphohydrolase|nr:hypothetical protein [Synergistaceae bacterium]
MTNFESVKDFMRAFDQSARASLRELNVDTLKLLNFRARLLTEEQTETNNAINDFTAWATAKIEPTQTDEYRRARAAEAAHEIVDGLIDQLYIIYGTLHTFGINADEAFRRVHAANMSKLDADGKPIYREDGKVLKGPKFKPPVLNDLITGSVDKNTNVL